MTDTTPRVRVPQPVPKRTRMGSRHLGGATGPTGILPVVAAQPPDLSIQRLAIMASGPTITSWRGQHAFLLAHNPVILAVWNRVGHFTAARPSRRKPQKRHREVPSIQFDRITVNGIDCPTFSQWIWKCTSVYQNIRPSVLCRRAINGFEHFLCCFSHCLSPPDAVPCALPHGRHRSFPCSLSRPLVPRARAPRTVRSAPTGTSRENDSNSRLTFLDVKL